MIKLKPSHITDIDRGRKFFEDIQDPEEYRAAASAIKFRDHLDGHAGCLSDYECCFEPGSPDWEYMKALYNSVLDAHFERTERSQEIREQAWVSADRVLSDALSEFTQAKGAVEFMDNVYRQQSEYTLNNVVGRNLKNRYRETVKGFLKARREFLRAKKRYEFAAEQIWKRDPDDCPGDGWVWVGTHRRKSRKGNDYVVDGYWRAPATHNPKKTTDESIDLPLLKQPEGLQADPGREPRKRRLPLKVRELIPRVQDALNRSSTFPSAAQMLCKEGVLTPQGGKWTLPSFHHFCTKYDLKKETPFQGTADPS